MITLTLRVGLAAAAACALALIPLAAAAPAVSASAVEAAPAVNATALLSVSTNWAGYYSLSPHHGTVEWVQDSLRVPKLNCAKGDGHKPYTVGIWAGIGGMAPVEKSPWLEQAGIVGGCDGHYQSFVPFWEIVPGHTPNNSHVETDFNDRGGDASKVPSALRLKPGDKVGVTIYAPGYWQHAASLGARPGWWTFIIYTPERNYAELYKLPRGANPGHTAEAITEWPEGTVGRKPVGLADFGTVTHSGLSYGYQPPGPYGPFPGSVDQYRLDLARPAATWPHGPVTVIRTGPARHTSPPAPFTAFSTTWISARVSG